VLEIVETLSNEKEEQDALRSEAEKTILRFIAAIVLADGQYRSGEKGLVSFLVDWTAKEGGEARYLNEYAAKWSETSDEIPKFFEAAVRYDVANDTDAARTILRNIQLIGNNVCACDSRGGPKERAIVQRFLALLETYSSEGRSSIGR
jgi:hypothetical protein